jgi:hypothetical protein
MDLTPTARRYSAIGVAVALLLTAVIIAASRGSAEPTASVAATTSAPIPIRANPVIGPFQGLGVWVDIYDTSAWAHPGAAVKDMASHNVRTLYLQTSNYNRNGPFVNKAGVIAFLDAASKAHIDVVAWYLPGFAQPPEDVQRSMAAITFRTPAGNRFSGFGLDIESPAVSDTQLRTQRLIAESASLRSDAGKSYPLAAIIPQPRGMLHHPTYWPGFPYQNLAATYDVMMPMTYFSWSTHGTNGAHQIVTQNIDLIRQNVGNDQVPIHVIGGIAQESTSEATLGFVPIRGRASRTPSGSCSPASVRTPSKIPSCRCRSVPRRSATSPVRIPPIRTRSSTTLGVNLGIACCRSPAMTSARARSGCT